MARNIALGALIVIMSAATSAQAQVFSDGFESYTAGANPLDKNYATGPNAAPNGSGNPWFGPNPPNARVVTTENGVVPHGGSQMIRGSAPSDFDQNWYNLAYRLNGGNAFTGNLALDWWFYDPLGAGGSNYREFAAVGFYNTAPSNTDYPGTGSLNTGVSQIQRLCLGTSSDTSSSFDANVYQARVVGATDGYSNGWLNLPTARTVGWHHGRIEIGPALGDNTNLVSFFIDDMLNPALVHNSVTTFGYNVLELNTNYGTTAGYFDDILFVSPVPEPTSLWLSGFGLLALKRVRRKSRAKAQI